MKFTVKDLRDQYPTDDICLDTLWRRRYPTITCVKCGRVDRYTRVSARMSYSCVCGHQVYPLAGTIFEKTSTPLTTWFYVIYVMSQTKSGVSAAYISRVTGVTYKCAWRMMHKIRELMVDNGMLEGDVEADETFFKAKAYRNSRLPQGVMGFEGAQVLFGATERGGRVRVKHLETASAITIKNALTEMVSPGAHLHTDGARHYVSAPKYGYTHSAYIHYTKPFEPGVLNFSPKEGSSTQYIEGFWCQLKTGMKGVYRSVSPRYLESYANEYAFRYSHRNSAVPLFDLLIERV